MYFAIIYKTGPEWLPNTPLFEQSRTALRALTGHRNCLTALQSSGKLVLGGPYADGAGGMALVDVDSEEEAASILAGDPAIVSGVFTGELHRWVQEFAR